MDLLGECYGGGLYFEEGELTIRLWMSLFVVCVPLLTLLNRTRSGRSLERQIDMVVVALQGTIWSFCKCIA